MPNSLRHKLLQALGAPSLLLLVAGGGVAYGVASSVVSTAYDQNLLNLAYGVANHVRLHDGTLELRLSAETDATLRTDTVDQIFFRVRDPAGRVLGGDADLPQAEAQWAETRSADPYTSLQLGNTTAAPEPQRPPQARLYFDADYRGQRIRCVRLYREMEHHGYYITVGETLEKRREGMERLLLGFASAALLAAAAAGIAVRFGIPSGLAPLEKLEQALARRSGTDLSPIAPASVPLEIREVVKALNALLDRLREAHGRQHQFLQDAAHQLRTPLASLQVELEMLSPGPDRDAATLARLRRSVARVTRLANQLLALARADSGQHLPATPAAIDLAELIAEMLDDWLRTADARQIDFGVDRASSPVIGDPTLLRELISNLVDNALKYTPVGGQITVHCRPHAGRIELDIVDNGPGIPPAEREAVFERFYRLPDSIASGSGLGLPIAREIVRSHGGEISLETNPDGPGTRVAVRLPAAAAAS